MRARRAAFAAPLSMVLIVALLACSTALKPQVLFGADRNGARVTKQASSFSVANGQIYFEVDSSKKFGGTTMTIQVLQTDKGADKVVDSADVQVPADDNVYSLPITPSDYGPGTYRITASINGSSIASGNVTFTP